MTPGPTDLPDSVRSAMQRPLQHPDVDPEFIEFYHDLEEKLAAVFDTTNDIIILGGEAYLGLETSIASVVNPGEKVLCLANGVYGKSFTNLVELYGGEPVVHSIPYTDEFSIDAITDLITEHNFRVATMVHCETPTGVLNDLEPILDVLDDAHILSIVDAVSSFAGTRIPTDVIDICIGSSQKCMSAPPGLTPIAVSDTAWEKVENTPQRSYYTSLIPWQEQWIADEWFPYTPLVSNLYALDAATDRLLNEGLSKVFNRHMKAADHCRSRGQEIELHPYSQTNMCSPTVTAFKIDHNAQEIRQRVTDEFDIVLTTSLGDLADSLIRVGHMGYNADIERVDQTMDALNAVIPR